MNIKDFKNLDKKDILEMLGIRSESATSSVLRTISLIAMGVVAGATVALLLSPKTGRELRESVARRANQTADDILNAARAKVSQS